MTPSDLEAIRERCEAATDDPWTAVHDQEHNSLVDAEDRCVAFCARRSDADSIVQTRQDIPALLAHIASLEKQRCQEPIEHGAIAAVREVLALKDENNGFIDDDVARVLMEREDAKARIAALEADVKALAEALRICLNYPVSFEKRHIFIKGVLSRPGVQAVLDTAERGQ